VAKKKKWANLDKREATKGILLTSPAIILLTVFTIYPIFFNIYSSLFDGSLISQTRNFVGLDMYARLINSVDFHRTVRNTVLYSVGLVSVLMTLSTLFAVWINSKKQKRLNDLTMAAAFTPHIISLVSVSSVFLWLMHPDNGIINHVITSLGLPAFPFLASPRTALASLVMMMIWKTFGFYSLLILAALQMVPRELYEAAELDRTSRAKVFFRITLPMISPTLFFTTIVATINSFQVFEAVNLMTQGGPIHSTNTMVFLIYSHAFRFMRLGEASAVAVVLLGFVGILTAVYFIFLGKKVHYK